jgi:hypothetical protein
MPSDLTRLTLTGLQRRQGEGLAPKIEAPREAAVRASCKLTSQPKRCPRSVEREAEQTIRASARRQRAPFGA